jgi:hypothetical protein
MTFRAPAFFLKATALSALAGGLLTACFQDPGQTGSGYLDGEGVRLTAPLYHLVLDDLPVDSVFATELPLDHFGESLLVVGRESRYMASARLGFQISGNAQHRALDTAVMDCEKCGVFLRLVPRPMRGVPGKDFLAASAANRDSLTLLVESFSWADSSGRFNDTLAYYHERVLRRRVPFSTLPLRYRELDTVRISPKGSYADSMNQDSSQAVRLKNLAKRLATADSTRKWMVYLNIKPLSGSADSGMYRFMTQGAGSANALRTYASGLWLGRYREDSISTVGTLVTPYRTGFYSVPASTYEVDYTGPSRTSLLQGVSRGVHLRIHRDTLLARIRAALNATPGDPGLGDRLLGTGASGRFDRRFYVPYAELRIPRRDSHTRVDGNFAFDVQVLSDVDSLAEGDVLGNIPLALGATVGLPVTGQAFGDARQDTLRVTYRAHPADTAQRQILLQWAGKPETVDTFTVAPDSRAREFATTRRPGWQRAVNLSATPTPAELLLGVYFSANSVVEPREIHDSTGNEITLYRDLQRRFVRPGADSLTVRVTRGLRQLLNRNASASTAPDLYLRGVERQSYDTSAVAGSTYNRVTFPVMGEVEFPRGADGKVRVNLDLYLYPLEGEP